MKNTILLIFLSMAFFMTWGQHQPCHKDVTIPETFTPNADGKNDRFEIYFNAAPIEYELTIYNRWGERVFETKKTEDTWDGKIKGEEQPAGVYLWVMKFKFSPKEEIISCTGSITLMR